MSLRVAGSVRLGEFALDVDLVVDDGRVLALLGPNGAGKSTLLQIISGLLPLDTGTLSLGETVLDDPARGVFVPPAERRVGVVFQEHRLFGFLRVIDNVAFGPRAQGVRRGAARAAAGQWLDRLGLGELSRRFPRQLSGGQAQRVALARALAAEPSALLLDEPMAALDIQTRAQVQSELREHLRAFVGPTLVVTHDPVEALLLADRIVVLEAGRIVQQGTTAEITARPRTPYVARVVGLNLFSGTADGAEVRLDDGTTLVATDAADGPVLVAVRPSDLTIHLDRPERTSARNVWSGTVTTLTPLADRIRMQVATPSEVLVDLTPQSVAELNLRPGQQVWLSAKSTALTVYPR